MNAGKHALFSRLSRIGAHSTDSNLDAPTLNMLSPEMKRVLVVDDEAMIRAVLSEILAASGYLVVQAENADRAVEMLDSAQACDLVITDIQMPGSLDGIGLADRMAQQLPGIPVLIMTGRPDLLQRPLRDNEGFLTKPFGAVELLAKLDAMETVDH